MLAQRLADSLEDRCILAEKQHVRGEAGLHLEGRLLGVVAVGVAIFVGPEAGGFEQRGEFAGRDRAVGAEQDGDVVEVAARKSTRELQSLMRSSYAVFCLKKKTT